MVREITKEDARQIQWKGLETEGWCHSSEKETHYFRKGKDLFTVEKNNTPDGGGIQEVLFTHKADDQDYYRILRAVISKDGKVLSSTFLKQTRSHSNRKLHQFKEEELEPHEENFKAHMRQDPKMADFIRIYYEAKAKQPKTVRI